MANEIISSIFFGLGIIAQIIILFNYKFRKDDLKEIIKDTAGGFLFVFYAMYFFLGVSSIDVNTKVSSTIYAFCLGFGAAFALSFKKKILLKINEINLLVLNILFLYYCITRLGFDNSFTKIIYILTLIVLMLILFKNELKNIHKGFLYLWYIILFMIIGTINIYQILGDGSNIYSSYLSSFFIGGIFLYIWIHFVCLIMFTPPISDRSEIYRRRIEIKKHFSDLANSFNKTKISNFKILILFIVLFSFLIINYCNEYISESLLIVCILFITSVSSAKKSQFSKKDIVKEN